MKSRTSVYIAGSTAVLVLPVVVSAQATANSILATISGLINGAVAVILALAILFFFWGLAQYILKAGDEEARGKARNTMIWGVVAIFVMVSVWGLVALLQATFEVGGADAQLPALPTYGE